MPDATPHELTANAPSGQHPSPELAALLAQHIQGKCFTTPAQTALGIHPAPACLCRDTEFLDQVLTKGSVLAEEGLRLGFNWRW